VIGNYKFEQFEIIPLFDVYIEVVVDPKIMGVSHLLHTR
jgi:hypothetical protein